MTPGTDESVASPCVSLCRMDPMLGSADERAEGGLCIGCLRTIDEIVAWSSADDVRKRAVLAAVAVRRDA